MLIMNIKIDKSAWKGKDVLMINWTKTRHEPCLYDKELWALYHAYISTADSNISVDL